MRLMDSANTILCRGNLRSLGRRSRVQAGVILRYPGSISIGDGTNVGRRAAFASEVSDSRCDIGSGVIIGRGSRVDFSGGVSIGNNVVLSEDVAILSHSHGLSPKSSPTKASLTIEDDVWIGMRSTIIEGVTRIGRGAVVAAGSVVTREVAANTVVGGVPARVIKSIDEQRRPA